MSNAKAHAEFCRDRVADHKRKAKDATDLTVRRFHESEASSWQGEARFYDAMVSELACV